MCGDVLGVAALMGPSRHRLWARQSQIGQIFRQKARVGFHKNRAIKQFTLPLQTRIAIGTPYAQTQKSDIEHRF